VRKTFVTMVLLVALAAPAFAGVKDDDGPHGRRDVVSRIVHFVRHILDDIVVQPPKP
jgi:hypothetical protein